MNFRRICLRNPIGVLPVLFLLGLALHAPSASAADDVSLKKGAAAYTWTISSKSIQEGQIIPKLHTADGKDSSPQLSWTAPPPETKSIALICDDPDAPVGTWVHWVIYNIPAGERGLPQAVSKNKKLQNGSKQGTNSFGKIGYNGPSPPPGKPHRYFFKIYALDTVLDLEPGVKKEKLLSAMKDHVLAEEKLMGTYGR